MKFKNLCLFLKILFLHLLAYCLLASSQAVADSLSESKKPEINNDLQELLLSHGYKEVSLRLSKNNFLMIDISLASDEPAQPFIVDTGGTQTSIDKKVEEKYQFKRQGKSFFTQGAGGKGFRTYQVIIPTMHIKNVIAQNQLVSIQHYSHIKVDKKPIAGMIGLDFLRQYAAIIDIAHRRLFLKLNSHSLSVSPTILRNTLAKMGYEAIEIKRSPSGHQAILIKFNDSKPVRFILDTGAAPFLIASYYANHITLKNTGNIIRGKGSSSGAMKMFDVTAEKITIGNTTWGPEEIIVTTGLENAKIGIPIFGSVGLTWMITRQSVLDTKNDLLFVK